MKRLLATAAVALSITTAAQAANKTVVFASNYWHVSHFAHNSNGNPQCTMRSQISFTDSVIGYVTIVWVKGKLYVYLGKTNWHIPPDMQVPFSVNLDNGRREFVGISNKLVGGTKSIGIMTSTDDVDSDWLDDFASSETMTVSFRSGNEPRWSFKMAGSRDASKAFQTCIKSLDENSVATSPVPQAPSTSPMPDVPTKPVQTVPIKKPKGESI